MKVQVTSPGSGYGPHGMVSWAPDAVLDIDDGDEKAVAFYRGWIEAGRATLVEDAKPAKVEPPKREAPKQPAKASAPASAPKPTSGR
jgi:hypothetical protein